MEWQTWMRPFESPYCPSKKTNQVYNIQNVSASIDSTQTNSESRNNKDISNSKKYFTSIESENIKDEYGSNDLNANDLIWGTGNDHSKWGISLGSRNTKNKNIIKRITSLFKNSISASSQNNTFCIGDMNRMASQKKRGGGAVCMQNKAVHDMLA